MERKDSRLLLDEETRSFSECLEMKEFFQTQKDTDIWKKVYISEIEVKPLENCPIMLEQIKEDLGMDGISDATIIDGMEDKRLVLSFPLDTMTVRPIRYTAFKTLCERAGLYGPALTCYEARPRQKEMAPEHKAMVLNHGLECFFGSKALILLRDEKVSAVMSGDERDYSPLPVIDLVTSLETGLVENFTDVAFLNAYCSHEIAGVTYSIDDTRAKKLFSDFFKKYGKEIKNFNIKVMLTTSDVGLSGANLLPIVSYDGKDVVIGTELNLTHKNMHTIEDFSKNVAMLWSSLQDAAQKCEELQAVVLTNPLGCYRMICHRLGLPKEISLSTAEFFEATMPEVCTAFDLYWAMWEIIPAFENACKLKGEHASEVKLMQLRENISRVLNLDVKRFDEPYEWL